MDPFRFDALSRSLAADGSRRGVLGLLAAAPVVGGLLGIFTPRETEARGRRKRRKTRNERRSGDDKKNRKGQHKKKPQCSPESVAQTCANTCGSVTNNCQQPVDCGSCACASPCDVCFTCQDGPNTPGTCVVDATQVEEACGSAGQVCQLDGTCACTATTCLAQGKHCGSIPDGCGGTLTCGTCPQAGQPCTSNVCGTCVPTCANTCPGESDGCGGTCGGSCPGGWICSGGWCCRVSEPVCDVYLGGCFSECLESQPVTP